MSTYETWKKRDENAETALKEWDKQARLHTAFYYNKQKLIRQPPLNFALEGEGSEWEIKLLVNFFSDMINHARARIAGITPIPTARAFEGASLKDQDAARSMQHILFHLDADIGLRQKFDNAALLCPLHGLTFFKPYWDPSIMVPYRKGNETRYAQDGQAALRVHPGYEFRWDPVHSDCRDSNYFIHKYPISVERAKQPPYNLTEEQLQHGKGKFVLEFNKHPDFFFYEAVYNYGIKQYAVMLMDCYERLYNEGKQQWRITTYIGPHQVAEKYSDLDVLIPFYFDKGELPIPAMKSENLFLIQKEINKIYSRIIQWLFRSMYPPRIVPTTGGLASIQFTGEPDQDIPIDLGETGGQEPHYMEQQHFNIQVMPIMQGIIAAMTDIGGVKLLGSTGFPKSASSGRLAEILRQVEITSVQSANTEFIDAVRKVYETLAAIVQAKYKDGRLMKVTRSNKTEMRIFRKSEIVGNYSVGARPTKPPLSFGERMSVVMDLAGMGLLEPNRAPEFQKVMELFEWGQYTESINPEEEQKVLQKQEFDQLRAGKRVPVFIYHHHAAHLTELVHQLTLIGHEGYKALSARAKINIMDHYMNHHHGLGNEVLKWQSLQALQQLPWIQQEMMVRGLAGAAGGGGSLPPTTTPAGQASAVPAGITM